jgi:hypothetical protein
VCLLFAIFVCSYLRIFQYFSVDNDVFVEPIHEEECQPSTSEKEDDNNTHSASAFSAKKCRANEEKRISKKLPGVQVSCSFLLGGYHQTDFLLVILKLLVNEDLIFLLLLFACFRATKQHQCLIFKLEGGITSPKLMLGIAFCIRNDQIEGFYF